MSATDKLSSSTKPPEHPRTKTSPGVSIIGSYPCTEITNWDLIAASKTQEKSPNGIHLLGQEGSDFILLFYETL